MQAAETKVHPETLTFLQLARQIASKEGVRVVEALRTALENYPDVSRVGFCHAAMAAGINRRTARNTYDRVHRA